MITWKCHNKCLNSITRIQLDAFTFHIFSYIGIGADNSQFITKTEISWPCYVRRRAGTERNISHSADAHGSDHRSDHSSGYEFFHLFFLLE